MTLKNSTLGDGTFDIVSKTVLKQILAKNYWFRFRVSVKKMTFEKDLLFFSENLLPQMFHLLMSNRLISIPKVYIFFCSYLSRPQILRLQIKYCTANLASFINLKIIQEIFLYVIEDNLKLKLLAIFLTFKHQKFTKNKPIFVAFIFSLIFDLNFSKINLIYN